MGVAWDRQDRMGRERPAEIDEGPDEVMIETVAGLERPRHVDVVVGIHVRGVWKEADQGQPHDDGEHVKGHDGTHRRCSLAPDTPYSDRYESPMTAAIRGALAPPADGVASAPG